MKQLTLHELAQSLLEHDDFLILTHRRPDGDTVGSSAALCLGLRQLGKSAHLLINPQTGEKYAPYALGLTTDDANHATVVSVDIAAPTMFPLNMPERSVDFQIDHHGRHDEFAAAGYVDGASAACGEIIYELLLLMNVQLTPAIAEALYVAVSTDTGCFRFSNVTEHTFRVAAACKATGADTFDINQALFMTRRMPRLRLEAYLTETTRFYSGGRIAISSMPNEVLERLGLTEDDIDDISGFGREIAGVQIAAMLREEGEKTKISVRTSPSYDAAAICALLGGGGHVAAAGATVIGSLEEVEKILLGAIAHTGMEVTWQTEY